LAKDGISKIFGLGHRKGARTAARGRGVQMKVGRGGSVGGVKREMRHYAMALNPMKAEPKTEMDKEIMYQIIREQLAKAKRQKKS
jgi:hypothetical protein